MKYYEVKEIIEQQKVKKMQARLMECSKNTAIDLFRDYYDGNQWAFNGGMKTTVSRSGKIMWNFKGDNNNQGFTRGELKVWNIAQPTVDIFASYVRGTNDDSTKITFEGKDEFAKKINDAIGDKDALVNSTTRRMSTDSLAIWRMFDEGEIEIIESKEYTPIYYGTQRVGSIRCYGVDKNDPIVAENENELKGKKHFYCEIWMPKEINPDTQTSEVQEEGNPVDNTRMYCWKFLDDVIIEEGFAEKNYDPYIVVINKKDEYRDFDEEGVEISDIEQLIDIQDDINAYVSDLSIINRQVAIPMYKMASEIWEKVAKGDLTSDQVKKELENLTLVAGSILNAPIEKMPAEGLPASSVQHLNDLFDQVYRITGIPKSIYNSEGIGNIADATLSKLMESMKRRIDEKRTNIEAAFKEYVSKYMIANDITDGFDTVDDNVWVYWADIVSMSRSEKTDMITKFQTLLPAQYLQEKAVDILGDSENFKKILGFDMENSLDTKVKIEAKMIEEEMKKNDEEMKTNMEEAKKQNNRDLTNKEANNIEGNA